MKKNNTRFNEKREREMQLQEQNNVVGTMVQVEQDSGINWDSFDEELLQNNLLLEFGAHEERSSSGGDEEEDIGSYLVFGGEGGGSDQNIVLEFEKREEGVEVVASGEEGVMQEACYMKKPQYSLFTNHIHEFSDGYLVPDVLHS
ncbi:hypothetical protein J5N97_015354 [Dioscorea zingiberensis]|uniref:Uncharacterized protein n=1 Tax=Dioscorea zingiberensis TaxID=325984 RepID=A0A9D5CU33_9LILI|nr:hypothetical protein J5N97_015354 [Dioscorea zingiberensis]